MSWKGWRLCWAQHAPTGEDAYSGEGARLHGGRWSPKGLSIAHASSTLSLAALEMLVHADVRRLSEAPLVACPATWPDGLPVLTIRATDLPRNWRHSPPPAALQTLGHEWLRDGRTAVLLVPSAVVPEETNVLISPAHPDAKQLRYGDPRPFHFDPRLL